MTQGRELSEATVLQMHIDKIVVGVRRRQKLGNIAALAGSIAARGLLHPIIVRNGGELVCGQRRLEACKRLGWTAIPVRHIESLSDDELRAIEFEENEHRLALADFESSKARLAQIRQAEADLRAKAEFSEPSSKNSKRGRTGEGRPKQAASKDAIADASGLSRTAVRKIETHVSLAERFPFMQQNGWVQHQVLEAGAKLQKLPEPEQTKVAALLDQPGIPPKKSVEIIGNMADMKPAEREQIYALAESGREHERTSALAMAAKLPPPPDPALNRVREALTAIRHAVRVCVTDEFKEELASIQDALGDLEQRFTRYARRANGHAA